VVTYNELEKVYRECVASGNEPNLVQVRVIRGLEKSVRRRVGRWLRRHQIQRGQIIPIVSRGRVGAYRV
jgi:hypothetical protein